MLASETAFVLAGSAEPMADMKAGAALDTLALVRLDAFLPSLEWSCGSLATSVIIALDRIRPGTVRWPDAVTQSLLYVMYSLNFQ